VTLADVNRLDRERFVHELGWVFEQSPWVAGRAWKSRPFESVEALHRAMVDEVARASVDEQLALLRAHPDLGARVAMTSASSAEQAAAGLLALAPAERERLLDLNARYRSKFGFPFLFAVKGSTAADILDALERRLGSSQEAESAEALRQVARIAHFRLHHHLSSAELP